MVRSAVLAAAVVGVGAPFAAADCGLGGDPRGLAPLLPATSGAHHRDPAWRGAAILRARTSSHRVLCAVRLDAASAQESRSAHPRLRTAQTSIPAGAGRDARLRYPIAGAI